jgi:hypothetical protein
MNLGEFIRELIQIVDRRPQYEELEVYVYNACGNKKLISSEIILGHYAEEDDVFFPKSKIDKIEEEGDITIELNAVLID